MTTLYQQLLADPAAMRQWLWTSWPYNAAAVQNDLLLDGMSAMGAATLAMPAGAMTLQCWVKPRTSASTVKYLAGVQNGGGVAGRRIIFFMTTQANDPAFLVINDAGTSFQADSLTTLPAGQWSHVAAVLDINAMAIRIYVGGALKATTAITGTFNTQLSNFTIGRSANTAGNFLDGELSEVAVWSVARQVSVANPDSDRVYPIRWVHGAPQLQVGSILSAQAGLYAYYRLNDGGGVAVDSSGHSQPSLTLTNPIWGSADWGAVQPYYFSSSGFNSEATDAVPSMEYRARIALPPLVQRSMYSGASIGGASTPDYGEGVLSNADGQLDGMRTLAFDGRRQLFQFGGTLSNGTDLALADYGTIFDGVGAGDALVDEQAVTVKLQSRDFTFLKPLQTSLYTTSALQFTSSSDRADIGPNARQTGSFTFEAWVYSDAVTSGQRVIGWDDGTNGCAMSIADPGGGAFRFVTRALSNPTLDTTGVLGPQTWAHVAMVFDSSAHTKTIYVNGGQVAQAIGVTGSLAAGGSNLVIGNTSTGGGGTFVRGKLSEVRLWSTARTVAQILANMRPRLAGTESGLVGYWPLSDGGISKVAADGSSGAHPAYLFGAPVWDVADWVSSDVAGKTVPLTYGEVLELEPASLDKANLIFQVHHRGTQKIQAVYDKGLALAAPLNYTGTDVSFTSGTKTIAAAGADFSSLVPGQQVTVTGSVANNATFTVATVATTSFTTVEAITTGAAGPSVTVASTAPGYTVDLTRGLFTLTANPAGKITAWVRGDNAGGYVNTAGDIIRRMVTRHGGLVDPTDLVTATFTAYNAAAPGVSGIYLFETASQQAGDEVTGVTSAGGRTLQAALEDLARGGCGYFGFTRTANQFQLVQFADVGGSPAISLDATNLAANPVQQTLTVDLPVWRVIVAYAQDYGVLGDGELAGDVLLNATRRAFATRKWRYQVADDPSVLATYTQARTLVIETCLINAADALAEAKRQLALFKIRRDMYRLTFSGAQPYSLDVDQVLTYLRNRFGLDAGRLFKILAFDETIAGSGGGSGTLGALGATNAISVDIWG